VATKAMHTDAAIAATKDAFADGCVATVQNGIGNERCCAARRARDPRHDLPAGKITAPGVVQWDVKGDTTLGLSRISRRPSTRCSVFADACTRAACRRRRCPMHAGRKWRKVIFNAATNPLGALTGLTHGRVCERPPLRRLASQLVDEGKAVATAQGSSSTPTRRN